jgi:hypothetical protein
MKSLVSDFIKFQIPINPNSKHNRRNFRRTNYQNISSCLRMRAKDSTTPRVVKVGIPR